MIRRELKGLIVPMITPFNDKGEIDEDGLRQITQWLIHSGVNGLFPNSSTGEMPKMSLDERKRVMKIVVDEANGKVPVLPGTGDPSTKNTLELTKYAEDIGADGVVIVAPYYFKPDKSSLIEHYKTICSETRIPIMLYNVPQSTGYNLDIDVIVRLVRTKNIFAMKDSSGDMTYFHKILLSTKELKLFQGSEYLLLPSLVIGASGCVLGMGNICPRLILALLNAYRDKKLDEALRLQEKLSRGVDIMVRYGFHTSVKAVLTRMGIGAGFPRQPTRILKENEKRKLFSEITDINLLEYEKI